MDDSPTHDMFRFPHYVSLSPSLPRQIRCSDVKVRLLSSVDPCRGAEYLEVNVEDAVVIFSDHQLLTITAMRTTMKQVCCCPLSLSLPLPLSLSLSSLFLRARTQADGPLPHALVL